MPRDELRQPLRKRSLTERLWSKRPSALTAASLAALLLFAGGGIWLSRIPYPFAGEPVVVIAIPPIQEITTASTDRDPDKALPDSPESPEDVIDENAGIAEDAADPGAEAPASQPAYQREATIIVARHRPLKPAPVVAVTETTDKGPLPRVSKHGKKPFDVYSQVTPMAVTTSGRPKIAILLGGMGLNASLTQKAIDELPGDISFGFAPYGENLQPQVNQARAQGHEVMLQVPMEPIGFPANNPGPMTLMADATPEENIESLHWHMSRFTGYSGVTNYMGARLLASTAALQPILADVAKRGLVYLEDATVNVTMAPAVGEKTRLPVRRANVVIDIDPSPEAIAKALAQLEAEATANGTAIGTGSVLPATVEAVSQWARSLQDKGILLIPVSVAYKGRAS